MKLSTYAKTTGISYQTAWKLFDTGQISGYKLGTGTIIITELDNDNIHISKVAIYISLLIRATQEYEDGEVKRLTDYCTYRNWVISEVIIDRYRDKTDTRIGLRKLLADTSITLITANSSYDLIPYGFEYIEVLLKQRGCRIELINK